MKIETVARHADDIFVINGILFVSPDPGNRHFREIQAWIDSGNLPVKNNTAPAANQEGD